MTTLLIVLLAGALAATTVVFLGTWEANAAHSPVHTYRLRFPRDIEAAGMQAFLGAVSGLMSHSWLRPWRKPWVALEVHADHRGIRHLLLVPERLVPTIESTLAAHLQGVTYEIDLEGVRPRLDDAAEYRLSTGGRPLQGDVAVTGRQLLAALQPLANKECVVVQVVVAPARQARPPRVATARERDRQIKFDDHVVATSEAATSLRRKQSSPLLLASLRIGVQAATKGRRRQLRSQVEVAWRATRAPGVSLLRRARGSRRVSQDLTLVRRPLSGWPCVFNTEELAALVALPIDAGQLPGVDVGGCRPLAIARGVAETGSVIGEGTHPSSRRPAALDFESRRHHTVVVGPTGAGKSVLLAQLALGDVSTGQSSLVVIDPKDGELITNIAQRVPANRLDDIIVLDPSDERPVGFDPLRATDSTPELVVDRVLGLMVDIWGTNVGPRSSDILRHLLLTISLDRELTLVEAPQLLTDVALRGRVLARIPDAHGIKGWWAWYDGLSTAERASISAAPLNKLRALVGRTVVAHTLGQKDPSLDLRRMLDGGKILLIRLPIGVLGEETTSLLGALLVTQLWQAIAARADLVSEARRPTNLILDEIGTILRFPAGSIEGLLSQARGYRVGITLAAQHLAQLPKSVEQTVLTNARTKITFAASHRDARILSQEFGGVPTAAEITDLDPFQVVGALYARGRTRGPATISTVPLSDPIRPLDEVLERSRARWGQDRAAIDEAHRARVEGHRASDEPTSRQTNPQDTKGSAGRLAGHREGPHQLDGTSSMNRLLLPPGGRRLRRELLHHSGISSPTASRAAACFPW